MLGLMTSAAMSAVPSGPPPLTMAGVFLSWTFDPVTLAVTVLLGAAYLAAVRRLRRGGSPWPRARTAAFLGALGTVLLVRMSFLGVYSDTLFWDRAAQNIVLLMITPLLLAMSGPLSLVLSRAPAWLAVRLRRVGHSRLAKAATFPLVVTTLLISPLYVVYLTPLYELSLRSGLAGGLTQLGLVCCGFVYFWTRLRVDPTPRTDHHLVSLWISMTEVIFDGALGLAIAFGPLRAPDFYLALHRGWGPDLRLDQVIGAGVLWIGGDIAGLPFVGTLLLRWRRDDQRQAEKVDRELDERERTEDEDNGGRLWWEDDPVLAERFRRG
jgi:cytochrome c oxidase assembly factor CtaG